MSLVERLGRHSAIYTLANILQRGTAFVLLPLYTRLLTPAEYGTIAVVTALNGVLVVLLPLALHGAIIRFYFDYRNEPGVLREFWGTILVFMFLCCSAFGALLLLFGGPLFDRLLGHVAFWPYVAIGIAISAAQPFFQVVQTIFQTREQPVKFAAVSVGHFLVTLLLTIYLVAWADWGAAGPLFAMLVSSILFAAAGLLALRRDFRLCLRPRFLRAALVYVIPQIPHGLASIALNTTDRFLLNGLVSLAATGIYNIAALFSLAVDLICQSVNRAYVPMAMGVLKEGGPEELAQLEDAGNSMVVLFCAIGASVTIFSNEIVELIATGQFEAAAVYVPFLAFAGVASGIYYVLVTILFFDHAGTRFIPVGTLAGAAASIGLNYVLITRFGAFGAAVATVLAQIFTTVLIGLIGRRFERVRWRYGRFALLFVIAFAVSAALAMWHPFSPLGNFGMRIAGWVLLMALLNQLVWRDPLHLLRLLRRTATGRTNLRGPS